MTNQANFEVLQEAIVPEIAEYFRTNTVMLNLLPARNFGNSKTLRFTQKGNLTMAVTAEKANATESTYDETSTTVTAVKGVAYTTLSDESEEFGGDRATPAQMAQEGGLAAADRFDIDVLALADGFSQTAGTTNVNVSVASFLEAAYKVKLGKIKGQLVAALHTTSIYDLQLDIIASDKAWINSANLELLNGQPVQANGLAGSILGIPIYETTNVKSINSGADWANLVFSPQYAFAAGLKRAFKNKIAYNVKGSFYEISVIMYYGVAEWFDAAGCLLIGDQ